MTKEACKISQHAKNKTSIKIEFHILNGQLFSDKLKVF